jgi:hypothetical protein
MLDSSDPGRPHLIAAYRFGQKALFAPPALMSFRPWSIVINFVFYFRPRCARAKK